MHYMFEIISAGRMLKRLYDKRCQSLSEKYGLRIIELDILYFIAKSENKNTATDIMNFEQLSKAHISKAVDNLKHKGFIALHEDENDRRYIHITITPKGLPIFRELTYIRQKIYADISKDITETESAAAISAISKITQSIDIELKCQKEMEYEHSGLHTKI